MPKQLTIGLVPKETPDPDFTINPDRWWTTEDRSTLPQYFGTTGMVIGVSLINLLLEPLVGVHATALIFLVAIVVSALFFERGPVLMAAALSALIWDYFFLPPVFAFRITHVEDAMLLGTYFVVALVLGHLTAQIRAQEKARRQGEQRALSLFQLTRELAGMGRRDEALPRVVRHMRETFASEVVLLLADPSSQLRREAHLSSSFNLSEREYGLALWTFKHNCSTRDLRTDGGLSNTVFLPLNASDRSLGVLGLRLEKPSAISARQRELLQAFAQQIALALDRHRLQEESGKAKLLAESERLSKTMLNSVSHEIRTPIAIIKSALANLFEDFQHPLSEPQLAMTREIQEANDRLDRLVGKILDVSRLESGRIKPKLALSDLKDLVGVALKETRMELAGHRVRTELVADLPLVPLDFVLTQQALSNLLSNAAHHTAPGTQVRVTAAVLDENLELTVEDQGLGIPPDSLPRIFDKFYRGPDAPTGGTGLGLSLVKGFIEAQGGEVRAANRPGGGAIFTIRLPLNRTPSDSRADSHEYSGTKGT